MRASRSCALSHAVAIEAGGVAPTFVDNDAESAAAAHPADAPIMRATEFFSMNSDR